MRMIDGMMKPERERLYEVVSGYFGLLAEPTRLKILNAICDAERTVSDIVQRVGASQTNVSRHLNLMHAKGVLKRRRDGQMSFYSVADPNVVRLCRTACVHLASQLAEQSVSSRAVKRFMARRRVRDHRD